MKQNKYDDTQFFAAYEQMPRSVKGLEAAGEWHILKELLPDLHNKMVLDLGCGFGWHCRYAREQGASSVIGVDISGNMLKRARKLTNDATITYIQLPIEEIEFAPEQFDVVISSLAFHYIESFADICKQIHSCLKPGSSFIFSVEHPIFTSRDEQDWYVDDLGNRLHWPVDGYQLEGRRVTNFLAEGVLKYHRTVASYMNEVIQAGFTIKAVRESVPSGEMLSNDPMMEDENRRPMFMIISAEK
ncbi:MAG TPA: class I SAM-dependent methyltransferase [Candidatus Paenibacillus intestinavium]|nr:class I SAM-dependent methyltransferase [Candidatus Paenibacillus intestinavium]